MSQLAAGAAARAALSGSREPGRMGRDWTPVLADVPPIVRAGDRGSAFYVLLDGAARVVTPRGRSLRLGAGDFFGEMALLDESPRSADVVADGEVLTMTITRSAFGKLLKSEPALAHELLRALAARL